MKHFIAVLDTNVILSAHLSPYEASPNKEIIERWKQGEFTILYTVDTIKEYTGKLTSEGITEEKITEFIKLVLRLGKPVFIQHYHLEKYTEEKDIPFLLCSINGHATHLVTYDQGFLPFNKNYEFAVCEPLEFLSELRGTPNPIEDS